MNPRRSASPAAANNLPLFDVRFFDASNGLATTFIDYGDGLHEDVDGAIFATANGGRDWTLEQRNPDISFLPGLDKSAGGFTLLAVTSPVDGHALWHRSANSTGDVWAATIENGRRVWDEAKGPICISGPYTGPVSVGAVHGRNCDSNAPGCNAIVGTNGGESYSRTTDAGITWVPDAAPGGIGNARPSAVSISYPRPTVAYAAGAGGAADIGRIFKASIIFVEVTAVELKGATKAQGLLCGGTEVAIRGKNFAPDSIVTFGGKPAQVVPGSFKDGDEEKGIDDELVVIAPRADLPGTVDVIVETPETAPGKGDGLGKSVPNDKAKFEYVDPTLVPPIVRSLSERRGPTTGGRPVTISGDRLACTTAVAFGDAPVAASDVQVINDGEVRVKRTPAHPAGEVRVVATVAGMLSTSIASLPAGPGADVYTYVADTTGQPPPCPECGQPPPPCPGCNQPPPPCPGCNQPPPPIPPSGGGPPAAAPNPISSPQANFVGQPGAVGLAAPLPQPGSLFQTGSVPNPGVLPVGIPGSATAAPASSQSTGSNPAGSDAREREKGVPHHAMVRRQPQPVLAWAFAVAGLAMTFGCVTVASRDPRLSRRAARRPRPQAAY